MTAAAFPWVAVTATCPACGERLTSFDVDRDRGKQQARERLRDHKKEAHPR